MHPVHGYSYCHEDSYITLCNIMSLVALNFALSAIGRALYNLLYYYIYVCVCIFLQIQSSVSVSKILVKTVERVRNTLSATHVIVYQGTMVPCVKMVSKLPSETEVRLSFNVWGANSYIVCVL